LQREPVVDTTISAGNANLFGSSVLMCSMAGQVG